MIITVPGFFSRSFVFLSMSLYRLSHNDLRLPNTLNKFHKYSNSMAGMNNRLFWLKNLWDFLTANFSMGNDFPAILCLYFGTSLQCSLNERPGVTATVTATTTDNKNVKLHLMKTKTYRKTNILFRIWTWK